MILNCISHSLDNYKCYLIYRRRSLPTDVHDLPDVVEDISIPDRPVPDLVKQFKSLKEVWLVLSFGE